MNSDFCFLFVFAAHLLHGLCQDSIYEYQHWHVAGELSVRMHGAALLCPLSQNFYSVCYETRASILPLTQLINVFKRMVWASWNSQGHAFYRI